jgi:hypothetical protein
MAARYVYSGAGGAGTGADWANAHATLTAAIAAGAAGDTYYVAHDHAESTASAVTLTFKGTDASPDIILCVNRAGSVPPVAADLRTTASVTTTGASALNISGVLYCYGIIFNCGTGGTAANLVLANASGVNARYESCAFNLVNSGSGGRITYANSNGAGVFWNNCTCSFASTSQGIAPGGGGKLAWVNTLGASAITGATIPTLFFNGTISSRYELTLSGLDLSALGSGKTIIGNSQASLIRIINCKLNASVTVSAAPTVGHASGIHLISSGSTTNVERNEIYLYTGTLTTETTIKRTGGASDETVSYCWKIATTANSERVFPFQTFEGAIWNDDVGSAKTLTIHTVTDNVTLTDAEIWVEVEYLGNSATPVATLITDANATVLTAPANQADDSATAWTTTGLGTPVKQKLVATFTPQMAGPIRWRVCVAKVSTTVYVCAKADLS